MARPRSEEKQEALLDAAVQIVAAQGLAARTAAIAQAAGVAEGTLFRYFATKDILLGALYLHLKQSVGDAMRSGFATHAPLEDQARSLWDGYIDWAVANPSSVKALTHLSASDGISEETRARAVHVFPEVHEVSKACAAKPALADAPAGFVDAVFMALADATARLAASEPRNAESYKTSGFRMFWAGLEE